MNFKIVNLLILVLVVLTPFSASGQTKQLSSDDILQKALERLTSLKAIKYNYHQEYNYASEAYFNETRAESYLEFTPLDSVIGLKYQFSNQSMFEAYNGSEIFYLNKKNKTIKVEPKPKAVRLTGATFLQFTPLMLRNALPKIIADKTIIKSVTETEVNNHNFYVVEFTLNKAFIESAIGDIKQVTIDRKFVYRLTVNKNNFMPVEVYRGNNDNKDFNRTTYSDIVENPAPPIETSWYYSTYLNEYKYAEEPKNNLIKTGEIAHEISLPLFPKNEQVSLSQYKGKIVLLDFWIFHCGYCQESVPKLNALQEKYKNKPFKLLTVNTIDSAELIQMFIKKTKSKFPILYKGEEIAKKYGVVGYPTVVLIDKDGKVIYSGSFDRAKIEMLISSNL